MEDIGAGPPRSFRQLLDAVITIGADLDLLTVLQHIVDAATSLADARYGALGVLDPTRTFLTDFLTVGVDEETRADIGELPKGHGILGLLIADPRPLRLPDLRAHPDSFGFPPGHPPMRSFLGVTVTVRGAVFGNLYLTDKRSDDAFSEADEELLVGFATAAGIAIDNARLHASLSELALVQDRERIAMDLHDTVIQQLFAVGLSLQAMLRRVKDPDLTMRVETAVQDLDNTIKQIRTTIFDLDAPARSGGVRERLLALVAEVRHCPPGRLRRWSSKARSRSVVDEAMADELVTVLREALSNVARHARASRIEVTLTVDDATVSLTIEDDGDGPPPPSATSAGNGLRNLASRAERLGGHFELQGRRGGGARQVGAFPARPEPRCPSAAPADQVGTHDHLEQPLAVAPAARQVPGHAGDRHAPVPLLVVHAVGLERDHGLSCRSPQRGADERAELDDVVHEHEVHWQDHGEGVDADPDTPDPSQGEEPEAGAAVEYLIAPSIEVVGRGRRRHSTTTAVAM